MGWKIFSCKPGRELCIAAWVLCICASSSAAQQPLEHKVEKGDTLWSISERYFGRPDLWPKLWEMNPFITNPHLLKTGDLVRIGVQQPAALSVPEAAKPQVQSPLETSEMKMRGVAVGSIAKLDGRALFSVDEQIPWATVTASDSQRLLLAKGDLLFLDFGDRAVNIGDEFILFRRLSRVRHPVTGEETGTFYSARAKVFLKEQTSRTIYSAQIQESYTEASLGDLALPVIPAPSCLVPSPSDPKLRGVVIAAEELRTSFGRNSIVYLDCGRDKGLVPGSMLELVRFSKVPAPVGINGAAEAATDEKTVGRMIVLEAGSQTATALVLSTKEDLRIGASFRGSSSWQNPGESAKILLTCPGQP